MNFNDTEQQAQFRVKCSAWLKDNAQLKTQTGNHNPHGKAGFAGISRRLENLAKKEV